MSNKSHTPLNIDCIDGNKSNILEYDDSKLKKMLMTTSVIVALGSGVNITGFRSVNGRMTYSHATDCHETIVALLSFYTTIVL